MTPIRVAIGGMPSPLLRDILAHITDHQPDMELVPAGDASSAAGRRLTRDTVDVVVSGVGPSELPEACVELFAEPNPPVFVGLANVGRDAAVCVANAGSAQLVAMIRSAVRGVRER